jgi:membrane-bound inhibitor of C-type lysozyme
MPSPDRNTRHATIRLPAWSTALSILHFALLACAMSLLGAGCQRGSPTASDSGGAPPAAQDTAAPDHIGYRCADGSRLDVAYFGSTARISWPDGRSLTLPRAESASKGGGDVYVGETVSLQRDGNTLQLHDGEAPPLACEQA